MGTETDRNRPKRTSVGTRKGRVGYDRNDPNKIMYVLVGSKKISNDQELIQSDPISCPQNQKGNN